MKIGEIIPLQGEIKLNAFHKTLTLQVINIGDRPIQIGSHFHFYEVNQHLQFGREKTLGYRLDIPAGTAIRFQPSETKTINLVEIGGKRKIIGLTGKVNGLISETHVKRTTEKNLKE